MSHLFLCATPECFPRMLSLTVGVDWWHGRAGAGPLIGFAAATWLEAGGRAWWEPILSMDSVVRLGLGADVRVIVNEVPDYVGSLEFRLTVDPGAPTRAKARAAAATAPPAPPR